MECVVMQKYYNSLQVEHAEKWFKPHEINATRTAYMMLNLKNEVLDKAVIRNKKFQQSS